MGNYKLSNQAEADLYRIWLYGFQEFGEARADIYLLAFFERFDELAERRLMEASSASSSSGSPGPVSLLVGFLMSRLNPRSLIWSMVTRQLFSDSSRLSHHFFSASNSEMRMGLVLL